MLKNNHKNNEIINTIQEKLKANDFSFNLFDDELINKEKVPTKGKTNKYFNILFKITIIRVYKILKHFIGFEPITNSLEGCCSIQLS